MSTVKRGMLSWFGHVCQDYTLSKTTLQGAVEDGCHRRSRKDNIKEMDIQLNVVIAMHRTRQKSMGNHLNRTPNDATFGSHGN